jgi:hypothetical protein
MKRSEDNERGGVGMCSSEFGVGRIFLKKKRINDFCYGMKICGLQWE